MEEQVKCQQAEQAADDASESRTPRKPMKYYIDFENVHGPGLKGVDALGEDDHVLVFYSQAAETFHIEHAIDLLHSKAKIEFVEIDGGTRNSLDFQLVAALFGTISDEYGYAIVSGDGGFDAAIKMGQRLELPEIVRVVNILGDTELPTKPRSRRTRSSKSAAKEQPEASGQSAIEQPEQDKADAEASEQPKPARRSRRRGGSRRTASAKADRPADGQDETVAAGQPEEHAGDSTQEQAAERKDESIESSAVGEMQAELPEGGNSRRRGSRGSGKSGKREDVAALLAKNGVDVDQHQLSTIMQALNGAKKRQDFYRKIIQLEKQEKGLALYRQVRDYYEPMLEIVKA